MLQKRKMSLRPVTPVLGCELRADSAPAVRAPKLPLLSDHQIIQPAVHRPLLVCLFVVWRGRTVHARRSFAVTDEENFKHGSCCTTVRQGGTLQCAEHPRLPVREWRLGVTGRNTRLYNSTRRHSSGAESRESRESRKVGRGRGHRCVMAQYYDGRGVENDFADFADFVEAANMSAGVYQQNKSIQMLSKSLTPCRAAWQRHSNTNYCRKF